MTIFRYEVIWLVLALTLLGGCASATDRLKCDVAADGDGRVSNALGAFMDMEPSVLREAADIRQMVISDPGLVGFRGAIMRRFAGTRSYGLAVRFGELRSEIATLEALRLAVANDGDTLIGTTQEWQCKTLADSAASLSLDESASGFLKGLDDLKAHFEAYRRQWQPTYDSTLADSQRRQ